MEQTTPSMTGKQKRDLRKLLMDALDEMRFSKDAAQKVYGNGGRLKAGVKELLTKVSASDLLEHVATDTIQPIQAFSPKDYFVEGEVKGVKIGWVWDGLKGILLAAGEEPAITEPTTVQVHRLRVGSVDGPILAELGEAARTRWGLVWKKLEKQGHGEPGDLLVDGRANIFYPDSAPVWAVHCYWNAAYGWNFYANRVANADPWDDGYQFLSR